MLNQLVSKALKLKRFSAKNIFFISIDDPLYNKIPLEELLTLFQDKIRSKWNTKKLVIFDEIQYLKNWENHLKVLVDKYPNIQFVASGYQLLHLKSFMISQIKPELVILINLMKNLSTI